MPTFLFRIVQVCTRRRQTRSMLGLQNQTNREDLVCPNRHFKSVHILRHNRLLISFDCIRVNDLAYR